MQDDSMYSLCTCIIVRKFTVDLNTFFCFSTHLIQFIWPTSLCKMVILPAGYYGKEGGTK